MTNEQFDETAFHRGMQAEWGNETIYIKGVDFEERNILIERMFEDERWVHCSKVNFRNQ